jgi:hypothetical protein
MGAASGITQALEGAKNEMSKANNLTKSVEGKVPSRFAPKPSGQHAAAPYKMARSSGSQPKSEIQDTAESLADAQKNVDEYTNATK